MKRLASQIIHNTFKLIIVGDAGVGKTSIVTKYAKSHFKKSYQITIGVDIFTKTVEVPTNGDLRRARLSIWDTAGQERFSYVRPSFYRGAAGGLVVFDLSKRQSFENTPKWMEEVKKARVSIPQILVGNKLDLHDRETSYEEALNFASELNMEYFESSAKDNQNIFEIFQRLAELVLIRHLQEVEQDSAEEQKYVDDINRYLVLAQQAYEDRQDQKFQEALILLKKAQAYAQKIVFQEGLEWIEKETQLITQILKQQEPPG